MHIFVLIVLTFILVVDALPGKLFVFDNEKTLSPSLDRDFPDPSIVKDSDGKWYAFATTDGRRNVQVATAPAARGPWTLLENVDALPDTGRWTDGQNTWAPDVRRLADGSFVLYYSGQLANDSARHCVGVATSAAAVGPYRPRDRPLACPLAAGGAIDPAGFVDGPSGRRYVVYKVDGNSLGRGGACNNGVQPIVPTPLLLQELAADGVAALGDPVQLLDRVDADGPLVEAPNLVRTAGGAYVLLFSSGCWSTPDYKINYAIAWDVMGPYARSDVPLLQTGDFGLTAPGGATSVDDAAGTVVFHADCEQGRCMFQARVAVVGENVIVSR